MIKIKFPHVFVLISFVIILCGILTYIIPSGTFERQTIVVEGTKRTVVIPGTYKEATKKFDASNIIYNNSDDAEVAPVNIVQLLSAIPRGMAASSDIIFFIFIIGGVFGLFKITNTINAFIYKLLDVFKNSPKLLTSVMIVVLAIGGSTLGMGEEFIPLVPIFLIMSKKMGYDRVYGVGIVYLGAIVGFAAATTNPFTLNIAQSIAEVPLNSGMLFRIVFFCVIVTITIFHIINYGERVKNLSNGLKVFDENEVEPEMESAKLNNQHIAILIIGILIFATLIYSVQEFGWWTNEMSGGFLLIGIATIIVFKIPLNDAAKAFGKGMEEMVIAALVVGFARGVQIILEDGVILDTLVFYASNTLQSFHKIIAAEGMLVFQTMLNFLIPSGSGQAVVTMPLMTPLADSFNISRQTAVFAFTSGDGFSNMIIPTSGLLMAMLGLGKISYQQWLKIALPLFFKLIIVAAVFIAIAVIINY